MYPVAGLTPTKRKLIELLETTLPAFVRVLINHRPKSLRGKSLRQVMPTAERQPARLRTVWKAWHAEPARMYASPPTFVFAVLGQARNDNAIGAEQESDTLARLLTHWAVERAISTGDGRSESNVSPAGLSAA